MTDRVHAVMASGLMIMVGSYLRQLEVDGTRTPFSVAVTKLARVPDDLLKQAREMAHQQDDANESTDGPA